MLLSVQKIWDQAAYSAFTDLCRFRDRWVCAFREGTAHAGDNGTVRVLTSDDADAWRPAASLEQDGVDLRDPKLCVTPDGRLMLLVCGTIWARDDNPIRRSVVSFSADAEEWTPWVQVLPDGHWLWRVTWHRGSAYGVSKLGDGDIPKRGFLWRSRSGTEYELVHGYHVPAMSETTLRFTESDEAVALARRTGPGGGNAWVGSSAPPYTQWRWVAADQPVGGPNFIILPDGSMWAASRVYGAETRTGLFRMTPTTGIELALTLPSGGDTSYAGMVWHDDLLWMTYYSSHEQRPSIYLARIRPAA